MAFTQTTGRLVHVKIHLQSYLPCIPPVWSMVIETGIETGSPSQSLPQTMLDKQICFKPNIVDSFAERLNPRRTQQVETIFPGGHK